MDKKDFTLECLKARNLIYENVVKEMLGPGSEDIGGNIEYEVITDAPITRYSTGILFPQKENMGQDMESDIDLESEENFYDNNIDNDINTNLNDESVAIWNREEAKENIHNLNEKYDIKEEEEKVDLQEKINLANERKPSSMGFTFFTVGCVEKLNLRIKGAKYRKATYKDACVKYDNQDYIDELNLQDYLDKEDGYLRLKQDISRKKVKELRKDNEFEDNFNYKGFINALYVLTNQANNGFVREPIPFPDIVTIDIKDDYTIYSDLPKEFIASNGEKIKVNLQVVIYRKRYENNITSFTVSLVNNEVCEGYGRDMKSIFQPQLTISSEDNDYIKFVETNIIPQGLDDLLYDEEEAKLNLLYSKRKSYAIGHGVSVESTIDNGKGEIKTQYIPRYTVKGISFEIEGIDNEEVQELLSMKNLSDYSEYTKEQIIENLNKVVYCYEKWIEKLKEEYPILDNDGSKYVSIAKSQIDECEECMNRMKKGIKILIDDADVFFAFQLMNRSIMMQRVQGQQAKNDRYPSDKNIKYPKINFKKVEKTKAVWRPFQLAYILLCLESISNNNSLDRDLVDLVWVPTGGGKTEAYLGLTAFTIFLRRLRNPKNGGTTVIMRYTLRLLAAQQFNRASILICACELIRKEMPKKLGKERITIGLWIGANQTPNKNDIAKSVYRELTGSTSNEYQLNKQKEKNMFQILKCPWCGTKLERDFKEGNEWGYKIKKNELKIFCPEYECEFCEDEKGLPIKVVDEDIYKNPPTLLFGTVDKFAMTTWNSDAGNIFGLNSEINSPPELIIQDELHLISGALGSIVGQYETVVDILCSEKGVKPKIIASTATIRNAKQQCSELYSRSIKQFPPSGLYEDDSFFIKEDKDSFGREYVGIMPSGKTLTTTQVRLMSTLLNKVKMLDSDEAIKSKYWTLVGYFNTLKELGMTRSLVDADIQDNIKIVATRLLKKSDRRFVNNVKELTSRVSASEINNTLKDLEIEYNRSNIEDKKYAIDLLLASNMISVGVDVGRLNLMMVLEQPKLTSEYIQATSRVGRENPGIVFTLYNPTRSRDKSYYELFYDYHQSFYKYVEPTSVTCFSEQARERMLHSVLTALIRHGAGINAEEDAIQIEKVKDKADIYIHKILERIENIMKKENVKQDIICAELKEIKDEMDEFLKYWMDLASESKSKVKFCNTKSSTNEDDRYLLKPYGKSEWIDGKSTLQAMRNVDKQGSIELFQFGDEDDE